MTSQETEAFFKALFPEPTRLSESECSSLVATLKLLPPAQSSPWLNDFCETLRARVEALKQARIAEMERRVRILEILNQDQRLRRFSVGDHSGRILPQGREQILLTPAEAFRFLNEGRSHRIEHRPATGGLEAAELLIFTEVLEPIPDDRPEFERQYERLKILEWSPLPAGRPFVESLRKHMAHSGECLSPEQLAAVANLEQRFRSWLRPEPDKFYRDCLDPKPLNPWR